jgi:hypothetical protein
MFANAAISSIVVPDLDQLERVKVAPVRHDDAARHGAERAAHAAEAAEVTE